MWTPTSQKIKTVKVFRGGTADDPDLVKPSRPMTIKHLLTHTSGFRYGGGKDAVAEIYRRGNIFEGDTLAEFARRAAQLPLDGILGDQYEYGISIDVLGYVVEVVSGMPFDRFVKTRILDPLKMQDTFFTVPPEKRARMAKTYTTKEGKLVLQEREKFEDSSVPFGGMGLYSTIGDYARFAQMLLDGGRLEACVSSGRKTVELMMANHLNHMSKQTIGDNGAEGFELESAARSGSTSPKETAWARPGSSDGRRREHVLPDRPQGAHRRPAVHAIHAVRLGKPRQVLDAVLSGDRRLKKVRNGPPLTRLERREVGPPLAHL